MSGLSREESLGFHGHRTQLAFFAALESKLDGINMSPMEYIALGHLLTDRPATQTELAEYLSIKGATSVRLVDRLVRDGWVVREPDPDDGRSKLLVPTEEARARWSEIRGFAADVLSDAYRGIDDGDIERVKQVLAQVRRNLGTED